MSRARNTNSTFYAYGRNAPSDNYDDYISYRREMLDRLRREYERNRNRDSDSTDTAGSKVIEVDSVELYARQNAEVHHTRRYEILKVKTPSPVLRRGSPFFIAIRFRRQYDSNRDLIKLEFTFGPKPNLSKGTLVQLVFSNKKEFTKSSQHWDVRLHEQNGNNLSLQVQVPPSIGIGVWRLKILTQDFKRTISPVSYLCKENIYFLFNPWCQDDPVYMENDNFKKEYVLNDTGKIFVGSHANPRGRRWIYGQFTDSVLPACMFLLELTNLDYTARSNPIKVVRAVSAIVNSNDDNGVLIGNWSGKYEGGTAPWMWTGSAAILEEYMKNEGRSVRYGQCWVFAGVTTTVCRALGIPCRTVTNYVSAHDSDETMTIDNFYEKNGEKIQTSDSIWNFHVWNDCWMARPDLPSGYGGWQAIDATPQERSEGVYRAGPSSLVAIRRGEIGYMFDTPFIFSEVNADVVSWQRDETSDLGWKKMAINKYHVGKLLATKSVGIDDIRGDKDLQNITDEYKRKEGTIEERMTVRNAIRCGGLNFIYDIPSVEKEDVILDLLDIEQVMIGEPFMVTVTLENKSDEHRTVSAVLSASSVYYTGIVAAKVKRESVEFMLKPKQKEVLQIKVTADEYYDKLVDYSMIKIYAIATVKETKQTWSEEDDFQVIKPSVDLEIEGTPKVNQQFGLKMSFTNPLDRKLTDCTVSIECPGVTTSYRFDVRDVKPKETFVYRERLKPQTEGSTKLALVFNSRQLNELTGSIELDVEA
ncbi:hemocyte protein-glutamine gamma-glutamyltransferase-like [Centruroides vittatus]|uniref:hemocyte protein-glutamine gamma-glutamyltransferase-like n=1 Tax=Centruroides vittatus TaxID=120091 RepID=UPI00350FB84F